jgi:hypothetical protein
MSEGKQTRISKTLYMLVNLYEKNLSVKEKLV